MLSERYNVALAVWLRRGLALTADICSSLMSIVFVGTPEFAVPSLRRLVADGHEVSAVITQPDRPTGRHRRQLTPPAVKIAAAELRLPVLQPESLRDPVAIQQLGALAPEVMVVVAYGQILRQKVLNIPPRGVVNVHASLLPRYRGASPIAAAILAGDEETGVSIMLMDAGMDTGPVLAQRKAPISPEDTTGTLSRQLAELGADLLGETLPQWLAGDISQTLQDSSTASVTRLTRKEDGAIDWTLPALEIWRRVRAYNPWPGAYTSLDGDRVTIWRARPIDGVARDEGAICAIPPAAQGEAPNAAFAVQTGRGLLAVLELQRAGRKTVTSEEFLRGSPGLVGRRFG
jgi:methionyl-tRNA formyltransferase